MINKSGRSLLHVDVDVDDDVDDVDDVDDDVDDDDEGEEEEEEEEEEEPGNVTLKSVPNFRNSATVMALSSGNSRQERFAL